MGTAVVIAGAQARPGIALRRGAVPPSVPALASCDARPDDVPMLSRTADNLYWLSRYTERADFVARILDATTAARGAALELRRRAQRMGGRGRRRPATSTSSSGSTRRRTRTRSATSSPSAPTIRPRSATASRPRARTPARCARRSPSRCGTRSTAPGSSSQRFNGADMSREEFAALPRMGEGRLARLRRLGLPHHAAQRRLLVHAPRRARSSAPTTPPASST